MCDLYPLYFPIYRRGDIIYPAIAFKGLLKQVEPVRLDLVSFKVFKWFLKCYANFLWMLNYM